jgi:hypothetical protein
MAHFRARSIANQTQSTRSLLLATTLRRLVLTCYRLVCAGFALGLPGAGALVINVSLATFDNQQPASFHLLPNGACLFYKM